MKKVLLALAVSAVFVACDSKKKEEPKTEGTEQGTTTPDTTGKGAATAPDTTGKGAATTPDTTGKGAATTPDTTGKGGEMKK
jgi:hypothetical protein